MKEIDTEIEVNLEKKEREKAGDIFAELPFIKKEPTE